MQYVQCAVCRYELCAVVWCVQVCACMQACARVCQDPTVLLARSCVDHVESALERGEADATLPLSLSLSLFMSSFLSAALSVDERG